MSNPEEALFDSWQQGRKQGMSAGIRYERERIIKLLEDAMCSSKYDNPDNGDCMGYCYHCEWRAEIIELIKGETK